MLKTLRAVPRWGKGRHPKVLSFEMEGLFQLPGSKRTRLPYAADAYGLERTIEAVLGRAKRDDLLPIRDAAFVAATPTSSDPAPWSSTAPASRC